MIEKTINSFNYVCIAWVILTFIAIILVYIVNSLNVSDYIKYTDKKCVIESNKLITLQKDFNGKSVFLFKDEVSYSFYVETGIGYCLNKQSISDCYIKTISLEEAAHIDTVREYTEVEIVKRIPWFLRLHDLFFNKAFDIGDKYDIDEKTYHIIYIPQDSCK